MSLVVALVMLAVVTIIGISGVSISRTQVIQSANTQYQSVAMNQAESAMSAAEAWLATNAGHAGFDDPSRVAPGVYAEGRLSDPLSLGWTDSDSIKADQAGESRFVVERVSAGRVVALNSSSTCGGYEAMATCSSFSLFRITARGGARRGAARVVQALYVVPAAP